MNDVPALKEADCSVAMASGSDAARQVAQLVLLDNNFASMPHVVLEGRRVINNIRRSASLFLTKTLFSFLLAIISLIFGAGYPFEPIQLTLFSTITIGIPSFFLALEPNRARIQGKFLQTVIRQAAPGALCIVLGVQALTALATGTPEQLSTMATLYAVLVGLIVLFRVCMPFNRNRVVLFCRLLRAVCGRDMPAAGLVFLGRPGKEPCAHGAGAPRWWGDWRFRCSAKGWMRWIEPWRKSWQINEGLYSF